VTPEASSEALSTEPSQKHYLMKRSGSEAFSDVNPSTDGENNSSEDVDELADEDDLGKGNDSESFDQQIRNDLGALAAARPKGTLHSH
jgi:hypothetical protein